MRQPASRAAIRPCLALLGLVIPVMLLVSCSTGKHGPAAEQQSSQEQESLELSPVYEQLLQQDPGQRLELFDPQFGQVELFVGQAYTSGLGQDCIQGRVEYPSGDTERVALCQEQGDWKPAARVFVPWAGRDQDRQQDFDVRQYRSELDFCQPDSFQSQDLDFMTLNPAQ